MTGGKRVILAYSGGLDTTACIPYLKHEKGVDEVITLTADLGQKEDFDTISQKAMNAGASKALVINATEEFAVDFGLPALKANALYERQYPLSSALGRPLIGKLLVKAAEDYQADYVAHGCTGLGNDQIRFDLSVSTQNPRLKVFAPAREWKMTRTQLVEYITSHNIPAHISAENPYAFDLNLLGSNIESGSLDDPWMEPPESIYVMTSPLAETPDQPDVVTIGFEKGVPVTINGKGYGFASLLSHMNELAGKHGIGRVDMMENRIVGIKSREIYETPGYTVLLTAHREIENLTLAPNIIRFKSLIEMEYGELVYQGLWFSDLRKHFDAFIESTQQFVTGEVRLRLYKGNGTVIGRKSPYSLYNYKIHEKEFISPQYAEGLTYFMGLRMEDPARLSKLDFEDR